MSPHLTCFHFVFFLCSESEELDPDLSWLGSLRFTGCLSGVRFNSICPLKAALLQRDSRVIVTSPLVQSSCAISSQADSFAAGTTHSLSGKKKKKVPSILQIIGQTLHLSQCGILSDLIYFVNIHG